MTQTLYSAYQQNYPNNQSVNGRILEYLICHVLVANQITPFYYQAKSSLVPNIDYDLICWHKNAPVSLSIKTSLRERYKQADLESMALRQVYRNADCYLITLTDECTAVREKIIRGELFALKDCLRADNEDFQQLITTLKTKRFSVAQPIQPVEGSLVAH